MHSLPFGLLLDSDGWSGDPKAATKKKAVEIWHLYSYNLHKATCHGLNTLHQKSDKLRWRRNRRNFIIGRGSFVGMHRYAGLWTGDNASTWQFLQISVAQVLAIGLSGITVSGADVGGFDFMSESTKAWADPELLIRWYCAYSLLPWFRCVFTALSRFLPPGGSSLPLSLYLSSPYISIFFSLGLSISQLLQKSLHKEAGLVRRPAQR